MENKSEIKPPIGIQPRKLHSVTRLEEILEACQRYMRCGKAIPEDWMSEITDLNYNIADINDRDREQDEAIESIARTGASVKEKTRDLDEEERRENILTSLNPNTINTEDKLAHILNMIITQEGKGQGAMDFTLEPWMLVAARDRIRLYLAVS